MLEKSVYLQKNKFRNKYVLYTALCAVLLLVLVIFTRNDSFLYHDTVAQITSIKTKSYSGGMKSVKLYQQSIKAVILNGNKKGKEINLKNLYSQSATVDEKFKNGNQIFISFPEGKDGGSIKIVSLKRDTYLAVAVFFFLLAIIWATKRKGFYSILSLGINILLLIFALEFFERNIHILLISILLMFAFCLISLISATGLKKIAIVAISATLITVVITSIMYYILLKIFGDPEYFMMEYTEYLSNTNYFNLLFFTEILIGGLGAIMDVAISIATTVDELATINPEISVENLYDGAQNVAHDIMGTMVNVLFLSYFCGTVPLILIKLINQYGFTEIFKFHIPFEMIRFFVGSIGIILAIPISIALSISLLKKKGGH